MTTALHVSHMAYFLIVNKYALSVVCMPPASVVVSGGVGWVVICPSACWDAQPPAQRHAWIHTHSRGQTNMSINITLPQTSFAGGKNSRKVIRRIN